VVDLQAGERDVSGFQNAQTACGTDSVCYSVGAGGFFQGGKAAGARIPLLKPVSRLKVSGATLLFPLCAHIACAGINLPLKLNAALRIFYIFNSETHRDHSHSISLLHFSLFADVCCTLGKLLGCLRPLPNSVFAFTKLRKATISIVVSVCLSILTEQLRSYLTDFRKTWYFSIFRKSEIQVSLQSNNNNGTLHEDLCTFVIISRWILLRMRNVSDKSCRENQNTHFMFNNVFPKIVPFMR
jgi:hypothetical protein